MKITSLEDTLHINVNDFYLVPIEKRRSLPNCSAIYLLKDGDGNCLYVGQTGKREGGLVLRWINHNMLKLRDIHDNLSIHWIECDDISILDEIEKYYIRELSPKYNKANSNSFVQKSQSLLASTSNIDLAFVHRYVTELINIFELPNACIGLLIALLKQTDEYDIVALNSRSKSIICSDIGITRQTLDNYLVKLANAQVINRIDRSEFELSPNFFCKGEWRKVSKNEFDWELTIDYTVKDERIIQAKLKKIKPQ